VLSGYSGHTENLRRRFIFSSEKEQCFQILFDFSSFLEKNKYSYREVGMVR
jgi:hypothetical protein